MMGVMALSNVVGFDDGPFPRGERGGQVLLVGAVCARTRLDGVLSTHVERDGEDATGKIAELLLRSQFAHHIRAVLLDGIAVAGFNVVDIAALHRQIARPVLVVCRRQPRLELIRRALQNLPDGQRRWSVIEQAGPMEALAGLHVQRVGLTASEAGDLLASTTLHGKLPEPIRLAHLIAGGIATGHSHGRA
jgi:uncharacterized protein